MKKLILKTHNKNRHRVYVYGVGIRPFKPLVELIREVKEPIEFEDNESFSCLVRAMIKHDNNLTLATLHGAIRAGGILEYIKGLK